MAGPRLAGYPEELFQRFFKSMMRDAHDKVLCTSLEVCRAPCPCGIRPAFILVSFLSGPPVALF